MRNVKHYILEKLKENLCELTLNSLSRIISGDYRPSLNVAKWLAHVVGTQTYLWTDPGLVDERRKAVAKLAKRKKLYFQVGRGRPKK